MHTMIPQHSWTLLYNNMLITSKIETISSVQKLTYTELPFCQNEWAAEALYLAFKTERDMLSLFFVSLCRFCGTIVQ